jgi:glutamate 5-kinase
MTAVEGDFSRGEVIAVRDPSGREIARGLANYASAPRAEADETDNTTGSSAPSSTSAATTSPAT